jgi:aconitate hydratase/homoaconitate hydratase
MGTGSLAWLASAATVAASSVGMEIIDPRPLLAMVDQDRYLALLGRKGASRVPELKAAEPAPQLETATAGPTAHQAPDASALLRAPLQRFEDNVDTDAIIPGEFCHLTKLDELGAKAFHFVRPEFVERARAGRTIVVAGDAWGSGSSREQAVWALQGAGISCVIAKSYAFIHKRNLTNEGLPYLVVADPELYRLADEDSELEVDMGRGTVTHVASGRSFPTVGATPMVLALAREGGLVQAIQRHGREVFAVLAG